MVSTQEAQNSEIDFESDKNHETANVFFQESLYTQYTCIIYVYLRMFVYTCTCINEFFICLLNLFD